MGIILTHLKGGLTHVVTEDRLYRTYVKAYDAQGVLEHLKKLGYKVVLERIFNCYS